MAVHIFKFQEWFGKHLSETEWLIIENTMRIRKIPVALQGLMTDIDRLFPGHTMHSQTLHLRDGALDTGNLEKSNHLLHHFLGTKFILKEDSHVPISNDR